MVFYLLLKFLSGPILIISQVFFLLSSILLHQYFTIFGFLSVVFVVFVMTCAEIAIVSTYCQLCVEVYFFGYFFFCHIFLLKTIILKKIELSLVVEVLSYASLFWILYGDLCFNLPLSSPSFFFFYSLYCIFWIYNCIFFRYFILHIFISFIFFLIYLCDSIWSHGWKYWVLFLTLVCKKNLFSCKS